MTQTDLPATASRSVGGVPDPGEPVPKIAVPTIVLFFGCVTAWAVTLWVYFTVGLSAWIYIPVLSAASFAMFTVLHDAVHYSISRRRWVNALFGRLAMPFFSPYSAAPLFGYLHTEHHRFTNESGGRDPDLWITHAPVWKLPYRWMTLDISYLAFYIKSVHTRPRKEVVEAAAIMLTFAGVIIAAALTGNLWTVTLLFLIPTRIAQGLLVWWFGYWPHSGLDSTQRENRYRATRARVGFEWLLTPILLYQNYHLVHHLHPSIPFYRYVAAWKRNENAYLEQNPAITTVFGRDLSPDEYRSWRKRDRPPVVASTTAVATLPKSTLHAEFHELTVSAIDTLTSDSVTITFAVPDRSRELFRFTAGQHLTVRCPRPDARGAEVRRNYSLCTAATMDTVRIAVKRIPGGAFSEYATKDLAVGDTLEVMTPTGRFGPSLDPTMTRRYVAIAAGSGITPIISIIATALEIESESRFTLIYGNRSTRSTMFRTELADLQARFVDRFDIIHVLSREPGKSRHHGRIDKPLLDKLIRTEFAGEHIDDWYLCGPEEMVEASRVTLTERGFSEAHIHSELFHVSTTGTTSPAGVPALVTFGLSGHQHSVDLEAGQPVLEAALAVRSDTPYACMGGACGTCRAKLIKGSVAMQQNFALDQTDLDAGYILACQAIPTSAHITVDYDA